MFLMGSVYQNLGLYAKTRTLLEQAWRIDRRTFGPANEHTFATMSALALVLDSQGQRGKPKNSRVSLQIRQPVSLVYATPGLSRPGRLFGMCFTWEGRYSERSRLAAKR